MEDEQQIIDRNLKEGSPTELEIDEEMELDEGSAGEEEEEDGDPGSSPSPEDHVALGHGSSEQAGTSGLSFFNNCCGNIFLRICIKNKNSWF